MIRIIKRIYFKLFVKEYKIFLDDLRMPAGSNWTIARNSKEFKDLILTYGLPTLISFDHDLADFDGSIEYTGHTCAKWLIDWCMDNNENPPNYNIHSANPVGRDNIIGYFESYDKFRKLNK